MVLSALSPAPVIDSISSGQVARVQGGETDLPKIPLVGGGKSRKSRKSGKRRGGKSRKSARRSRKTRK
jgi:hypothetical protein